MADEQQQSPGTCTEHGQVTASRTVPASGFPYVVTAPRRWAARRKPFVCPQCGRPVTTAPA